MGFKVEKIKVKDLNYPKTGAVSAPQIDFGCEFEDWDDARKIRYLKKLSSAMNHATDLIQQERDSLLNECNTMKLSIENADKALSIQKSIVHKAITEYNAEKQNLISRIQELEVELKSTETKLKKYEA